MATNVNFKPFYRMVNSEMIGLTNRRDRFGSHGNYFLRSTWGTTDQLRGVLGTYWYPNGVNPLGEDMITADLYGSPPPAQGGVINFNAQAHSALSVKILPSTRDLGPFSSRIMINPNVSVWNSHDWNNTHDSLIEDEIITHHGTQNHSGYPNWPAFIEGAPGSFDWGNPHPGVPSNITTDFPAVVNNTLIYNDYATSYYGISNNPEERLEGGTNLQIEGVYNFYAKTTPPYEKISKKASESMLPNYYCFQSLVHTSKGNKDVFDAALAGAGEGFDQEDIAPYTQEYFEQVTLGGILQAATPGTDPFFADLATNITIGALSFSQTERLYSAYSNEVSKLANDGTLDDVGANFDENYKNMVMLQGDAQSLTKLVVGDKQSSGLVYLGFYNKITIPHDQDSVSALSGVMNGSYLLRLREKLNLMTEGIGDKFIDILQLYMSTALLGPAEGTYINANVNVAQEGQTISNTTQALRRLGTFEDFVNDCRALKHAYDVSVQPGSDTSAEPNTTLTKVINRLNPGAPSPGSNTTPADNFILLRDRSRNISTSYNEVIWKFLDILDGDDLPQAATGAPNSFPTRGVRQLILQPELAPSETLMYEIKKRVLNADGSPGAIVQTIIIGKPFEGATPGSNPTDVTYIDSQIKYGVRYHYEINAIKIIYGNRYCYRDLYVKTLMGSPSNPIPPIRSAGSYGIANALGFTDVFLKRDTDIRALYGSMATLANYRFGLPRDLDVGVGNRTGPKTYGSPVRNSAWGNNYVFGYYIFKLPPGPAASQHAPPGGFGPGMGTMQGYLGTFDSSAPSREDLLEVLRNGTDYYSKNAPANSSYLSRLKLEYVKPLFVPGDGGSPFNNTDRGIGGAIAHSVDLTDWNTSTPTTMDTSTPTTMDTTMGTMGVLNDEGSEE